MGRNNSLACRRKRFGKLFLAAGTVVFAGAHGVKADSHPGGIAALNSRPGAAYTVYLDFAGFNYSGTWSGSTPGSTPAYDIDGNTGSFSPVELGDIDQIWARVAEKYAPYNVNVTTIDPAPAGDTDTQRESYYDQTADLMHTVIGGSGLWIDNGNDGGISFLGVDKNVYAGGTGFHTNWVFSAESPNDLQFVGEAVSHENGHGFGLSHQSDYTGVSLINEYSTNSDAFGNGSYAPIMGDSYSAQRGTWRMGTSDVNGLQRNQNDPQVIEANPGMGSFVNDGIGHTLATATPLPLLSNTVDFNLARGIITPDSSASPNPIGTASYTQDYFTFHTSGGPISLTAYDGSERLTPGVVDPGATLNSTLQILDANGTLVGTATLDASTLFETYVGVLPAGAYYAEISSAGGYTSASSPYTSTEYYDMGSFFVSGSLTAVNINSIAWGFNGNGSWSAGSKWTGGTIPQTNTNSAVFAGAVSSPATVTLDAKWTVAAVSFLNSNSYTLAAGVGSGALVMDNGGAQSPAGINDSGGSHFISAPVILNSDLQLVVNNPGDSLTLTGPVSGNHNLTISGGGTVILNASVNVGGSETIGYNNSGHLWQTGGTNSAASVVLNTGGTLSLLGGGTLTCASFNQSGGSASFVSLNIDPGDILAYNLSGGIATAGGSVINVAGGVLNVSGTGNLSLNGTLAVSNTAGSAVSLGGGSINVSALNFNGAPAMFNWAAGTLNLSSSVTFDALAATNSTSAAFGSALTLGINQNLAIGGNETIGGTGTFKLTVSGGTDAINAGGALYVDANNGSTGFCAVSGTGTVRATGNEYVGESGSGNFNQSGGTNTLFAGELFVGHQPLSTGTYTLSGGSLNAQAADANGVAEYIGYSGTGTFTQIGGANLISGNLDIGFNASSSGIYLFSGAATLTPVNESVGVSGTGELTQTGGANTPGYIIIGANLNSTGSYTLSSGTLNATGTDAHGITEYVGLNGNGTFIQTGGRNSINAELDIGANSGSTGTYSMSGGSVAAANIFVGGGSIWGAGGSGNLIQTAATASLNVSGTITAYNTGGTGVIVKAGSMSAAMLSLAGGSFTQTGGSATFTQISGTGGVKITGGKTTLSINGGRSQVNSLIMGVSGRLDITNNSLAINFGSPNNDPVATIAGYLALGYSAGKWTGTNIDSSTAAAGTSGESLSVGYADGNTDAGAVAASNQIVVKYTLAGDANLDSLVNFNDLVAVVQNFNKSGTDWAHGNFTYAASTNFNDLVAVIQNFNKTLTPAGSSEVSSGGDTIALGESAQIQSTDGQLPEPGIAAMALVFAGSQLATRKRRGHRKMTG